MSSNEFVPYSEYFEGPTDDDFEESSATTRIAPASYERHVREALIARTGSLETYLTIEQEYELARIIGEGQRAVEERIKLEAQIEKHDTLPAKLEKAYFKVLGTIRAGKEAERTLVECNLKLSSYLARASMNILPPGDDKAIGADNKAGARRRALKNHNMPWLPRDFTSLKSRHAVLDDRIQIANMGLMKAARTFKPLVAGRGGKPVSFMSFAAPVIKTVIGKYVKADEKPTHIPSAVVDDIIAARYDDDNERFTPEQREKLIVWDLINETISLDTLYFNGAIDEEKEQDDDLELPIWAGEVIPSEESDDPVDQLFEMFGSDLLHEALGTLSEREAGVLKLRYGITDGQVRTLDEIGEVYGVTRERIRQIENTAMTKMRHPARSQVLRGLMTIREGDPPMRSGDIVKTQRTLGRSLLRLVVVPAESEAADVETPSRERWQAYPDEPWDEPVRITPEQFQVERDATTRKLRELLFSASLYTFQKSFAEETNSPYPKLLVDRINEEFGRELTPERIADFWNKDLTAFLQHLHEQLGDDASPERATQLLSRLLAERMTDSDQIELRVPPDLNGRLTYVGAWLSHGVVRVMGDLGDYTGHEMGSLGHLQIDGNVGHFAGNRMGDYARLEIDGDAGDYLGTAMRDGASLLINGNVGDYCGYYVRSRNVTIEVLGAAGDKLGADARSVTIIVNGDEVPLE